LSRLALVNARLDAVGSRRRLPLVVRIDDPWLAESWRAQQFGGADTRWAADAVGKYEVTAGRLLGRVVDTAAVHIVIVCGLSRLTLALCAGMARRQSERDFLNATPESSLPTVVWWTRTPRSSETTSNSTSRCGIRRRRDADRGAH
jgi:hypothetical protein